MAKELSSKRRRLFWRTANRICVTCGTRDNLTIDHILARSLGGTNAFANLQILCDPCNFAKSLVEKATHEKRQRELSDLTAPTQPALKNNLTKQAIDDEFRRLMQDNSPTNQPQTPCQAN